MLALQLKGAESGASVRTSHGWYEAAQVLLTRASGSWLKVWGLQLAKRRGMKRAIVATARRLSVILHRMWTEGSDFRFSRQSEGASA